MPSVMTKVICCCENQGIKFEANSNDTSTGLEQQIEIASGETLSIRSIQKVKNAINSSAIHSYNSVESLLFYF